MKQDYKERLDQLDKEFNAIKIKKRDIVLEWSNDLCEWVEGLLANTDDKYCYLVSGNVFIAVDSVSNGCIRAGKGIKTDDGVVGTVKLHGIRIITTSTDITKAFYTEYFAKRLETFTEISKEMFYDAYEKMIKNLFSDITPETYHNYCLDSTVETFDYYINLIPEILDRPEIHSIKRSIDNIRFYMKETMAYDSDGCD